MTRARIQLPVPRDLTMPLTEALRRRASCRSFAPDAVSDEDLSALLWSAAGISRPDGKRTAPSSNDLREIALFALRQDGVWAWNPEANALEQISGADLRAASTPGQHEFVDEAPVTLVLAADLSERTAEARPFWIYFDAGCIAQNLHLACEALGLAGVVRGWVDFEALARAMGIADTHRIVACFTLGTPASARA